MCNLVKYNDSNKEGTANIFNYFSKKNIKGIGGHKLFPLDWGGGTHRQMDGRTLQLIDWPGLGAVAVTTSI